MLQEIALSPAQLEAVKQIELTIMDEIHRICTKHGIRYSLAYGSLLGAVRHKGFIPWDDDMDIIMERPELDRFKQVCKTELDSRFFYQDQETDPEFDIPFLTKIRMNGTALVESSMAKKKMHHGVWVDIFVNECVSSSTNAIVDIQHRFDVWKKKYGIWHSFSSKNWKGKVKCLFDIICPPYNTATANKMFFDCVEKHRDLTGDVLLDPCFAKGCHLQKKELLPISTQTFEGREYLTVAAYDLVLKCVYGDYMTPPPVEARRTAHRFCEITLPSKW